MTKITYIGEKPELTAFGTTFTKGEPENIENKNIIAKLSGNRFFEVEAEDEPKKELTNKQMKELLEAKDIDVPSGAKKEDLLALMEANNLTEGS